jgi:hypothetical protein
MMEFGQRGYDNDAFRIGVSGMLGINAYFYRSRVSLCISYAVSPVSETMTPFDTYSFSPSMGMSDKWIDF